MQIETVGGRVWVRGIGYAAAAILAREDGFKIEGEDAWAGKNKWSWRMDALRKTAEQAVAAAQVARSASAEVEAKRQAEIEQFASVTPDWPTYNRVMALGQDASRLQSAIRQGFEANTVEAGIVFDELMQIADSVAIDRESDFGQLVVRVAMGEASASQTKAAAVGLAKRKAAQ